MSCVSLPKLSGMRSQRAHRAMKIRDPWMKVGQRGWAIPGKGNGCTSYTKHYLRSWTKTMGRQFQLHPLFPYSFPPPPFPLSPSPLPPFPHSSLPLSLFSPSPFSRSLSLPPFPLFPPPSPFPLPPPPPPVPLPPSLFPSSPFSRSLSPLPLPPVHPLLLLLFHPFFTHSPFHPPLMQCCVRSVQ